MKNDLVGKTVYFMFLVDELQLLKVKLKSHVPEEEERDMKGEDEYKGKIIKRIHASHLADDEPLYVADMYFTDRSVMKGIFKLLQK